MEDETKPHIEALLKSIEDSLQWGASSKWSTYDFEKLANLIHEKTRVIISVNTLKRLWGRIKYESNPSDTTLNTLAQFLGYTDFRDYLGKGKSNLNWVEKSPIKPSWLQWPPFKSKPSIIFVSGAIFMLITLIVLSYTSADTKLNPDDFYFNSRKVTMGVPNSVVFEYQAKNAPEDAKVEIQQSWDVNNRQTVSREDSLATAIYYEPGYFKARLVVDGQTLKEHGVFIPSQGWNAEVEAQETKIYLKDSTVSKSNGKIWIEPQLLKERGIDLNSSSLKTSFFYVDEFRDLHVDDLSIETELRNTVDTSLNGCQNTDIILLLEGEAVKIPLSTIGCISELTVWNFDEALSGKNNDFSKLGVNFDKWVKLGISTKNDRLFVYINDKKALELPLKRKVNKLYGLIYRFAGTGEIKSLVLKNSENTFLDWSINQY
ncbi:MAG: hypothetical protein AAF348_03240 [Bacteroidota bacterium]